MPPWKPRGEAGQFVGARVLTAAQIATIRDWAAQGAVEGDPADLPPPPAWRDRLAARHAGSHRQMPEPFTLRADGPDVFRTFVLPIPTDARAMCGPSSSGPGMRAPCTMRTSASIARARRVTLDGLRSEPGYAGGMVPDAGYPPGYMLGWTPGQRPRPSPDGMPWRLEPRERPGRAAAFAADRQARAGAGERRAVLHRRAADATPVGLRLGSETIDIAAGDATYADHRQLRAAGGRRPARDPAARAQPRTHHARQPRRCPTASTRTLIDIDDWDFRWQDVYRYANADRAAARHHHLDAVHLRQLRREPAQPAPSAGARRRGARTPRTRWATCGSSSCRAAAPISRLSDDVARKSAPKIWPRTRRSCRPIRRIRCGTTPSAMLFLQAGQLDGGRRASCASRCASIRARRRRTTTSVWRCRCCGARGGDHRVPGSPSAGSRARGGATTTWAPCGTYGAARRGGVVLSPRVRAAARERGGAQQPGPVCTPRRARTGPPPTNFAGRSPYARITRPRWRGLPGSWRPAGTRAFATRRRRLGRVNGRRP